MSSEQKVAIIATFYTTAEAAEKAMRQKRHPEDWLIIQDPKGFYLTTNTGDHEDEH